MKLRRHKKNNNFNKLKSLSIIEIKIKDFQVIIHTFVTGY